MRAASILVVLGLCCAARPAHAQDDAKRVPLQVLWDQKIPMRDGVKLSATIYRDPRQTKKLPAILVMTPYVADEIVPQAEYFAQHGYVFVAVDLRGRANSEGVFVPGQNEGPDGYDTVEWLAQQPWNDGQVATWGGSWRGFVQWSLAKELPPHLKTMVPTAPVHLGIDFPQAEGIFSTYDLQWLAYVHGKAVNTQLLAAGELWSNFYTQWIASGRPFQDFDELSGLTGTVFRTWLAHPREDAYWQAVEPTPQQYAKLRIPILTITGHYDGDQLGALTYYGRHLANGPRDVTQRHYLVIGPWDHAGTRRPTAELGGVSFGNDAVIDVNELHLAWYDYVMKGGPRPAFLKDRVACFVTGRNTWVYASSLGQLEAAPIKLALDVAGAVAGDVTRSGQLTARPPAARAQVTLISNPHLEGSREDDNEDNPQFLRDQRMAYRGDPTHVSLYTAPFPAETVLSGRPKIRIQLAVDQPDADVFVNLAEVLPDGTSIDLAMSAVRLRYRKGGVAPVLMKPGKPELVEIPDLQFFARAIAKGSRLRLTLGAGPMWGLQRNTNTGGDLASEPLARGRIAKITILTGPGTGSAIELPRPDDSVLHKIEIAGGGGGPARPR